MSSVDIMKPKPVTAPAIPILPGAHRLRRSCRHAIGLLLLAACGCSPVAMTGGSDGSTHLFAWAWDVDSAAGDFLVVVDVDRSSATYGQVVSTLPTLAGRGAHHRSGFRARSCV